MTTKTKLIGAAYYLFAEQGIKNTSIRAINNQAGIKHQSAVYYHFGDFAGLVKAVVEHSVKVIIPQLTELMTNLETKAEQGKVSVRDVVRGIVLAQFALGTTHDGRNYTKLMSYLVKDYGEEGKAIAIAAMQPFVQQAELLLQKLIPQLSSFAIKCRLMFALGSILNMSATTGMEDEWLGEFDKNALINEALDFFEGGILFNTAS